MDSLIKVISLPSFVWSKSSAFLSGVNAPIIPPIIIQPTQQQTKIEKNFLPEDQVLQLSLNSLAPFLTKVTELSTSSSASIPVDCFSLLFW